MEFINPSRGYSDGVKAGSRLYVAGQVAYAPDKPVVVGKTIVEQFDIALGRVVSIVRRAGGRPDQIAKFTIFTKNLKAYKKNLKKLGAAYQKHMGRHYPAMSCVEVKDLFDAGALVEIEAIAELSV